MVTLYWEPLRFFGQTCRSLFSSLFFFVLFIPACQVRETLALTVTNRSASTIDSVVVEGFKLKRYQNIEKGGSRNFEIDVSAIDTRSKGGLKLNIYRQGRKFSTVCGVYDFGEFLHKEEEYFLFDHGINNKNVPIAKPEFLEIFFQNRSKFNLDSFDIAADSILKVYEQTPRKYVLLLDFEKARVSPFLSFFVGGIKHQGRILHDFENWNYSQTTMVFEEGETRSPNLGDRNLLLEFIVEFQIDDTVELDSVNILSPYLVKDYKDTLRKNLKVVFDYNKLKTKPIISIVINGNRYDWNLKVDLENPDIDYRILHISEKGVKSNQ